MSDQKKILNEETKIILKDIYKEAFIDDLLKDFEEKNSSIAKHLEEKNLITTKELKSIKSLQNRMISKLDEEVKTINNKINTLVTNFSSLDKFLGQQKEIIVDLRTDFEEKNSSIANDFEEKNLITTKELKNIQTLQNRMTSKFEEEFLEINNKINTLMTNISSLDKFLGKHNETIDDMKHDLIERMLRHDKNIDKLIASNSTQSNSIKSIYKVVLWGGIINFSVLVLIVIQVFK